MCVEGTVDHLYADGARIRVCHVGMRTYWSGAFGCFCGFSPQALSDRILDCESSCIVTAERGVRGGKELLLQKNVEEAGGLVCAKGSECSYGIGGR